MRRMYYLVVAVLVVGACKTADERIPQDKFVDLLIDLHKLDAITADYGLRNEVATYDSLTLEASVLKKHNTTRKAFEETMSWYSTQPKLLAEVYDEVFGQLNRMNEEIKDQLELFTGAKSKAIWQIQKYKHFAGDTISYPEPYVISAEGAGTYLFDFKIRMLPQDKCTDPFLHVYFTKTKDDLVENGRLEVIRVPIMKSNYTRDYQYIHELNDTNYKYIKIIIPDTPDRDAGKQKNLQISKLRILKKVEENAQMSPNEIVDTEAKMK